MAEREVRVVFDPLVLQDALLGREDSAEYEALEVLVRNCPNKLVINDNMGKLGGVYLQELKRTFPSLLSLQTQLSDRISESSKVVEAGGPSPIPHFEGIPSQHSRFLRRALGVRPRYLVFRVRQWNSEDLRRRIQQECGVEMLSPQQYVQREGQEP